MASRRRLPFSLGDGLSSARSGSTSVLKLSGVRLSTVGPDRSSEIKQSERFLTDHQLPNTDSWYSHLLEPIADAVERFDHVEVVVAYLELLAHALDVAVDGAVVEAEAVVCGGRTLRVGGS